MQKPKAILFDYGDTIMDSEYIDGLLGTREILKYAVNDKNLSAEVIQDYVNEIIEDVSAFDYTNIRQLNGVELHKLVYGIFNITFTKSFEELDAIFLEHAEKVKPMDKIVDAKPFMDINYLEVESYGELLRIVNSHWT